MNIKKILTDAAGFIRLRKNTLWLAIGMISLRPVRQDYGLTRWQGEPHHCSKSARPPQPFLLSRLLRRTGSLLQRMERREGYGVIPLDTPPLAAGSFIKNKIYAVIVICIMLMPNVRANSQIFTDDGALAPRSLGKFVGIERLVSAAQWGETFDQLELGGLAGTFAPQSGANQGMSEEIRPVIIKRTMGNEETGPDIIRMPIISSTNIAYTDSSSSDPEINETKHDPFYSAIIIEAADRHDVDPALIKAIIMAESRFNPTATSAKGAMGLMQIMPRTASAFSSEDMYDPVNNINVGAMYFKILLNKFDGDLELALAAYNAGPRKVMEYQGVPPYKETRDFIRKVFACYARYKEG